MMNFDDRIKEMAQSEPACVPDGFGRRMDRLADSLGGKKERRRPRLRGAQVAAIAVAVCLLAGGTVFAQANGWVTFGWDGETPGEISMEEAPADANTSVQEMRDEADYSGLLAGLAQNETYRVVESNGDAQSSGHEMTITSPEQLEGVLEGSVIPYGTPRTLPEGYSFNRGWIYFGLSPELIDPDTGPSRTEQLEDGRVFEVYALPDGYERYIEYVFMEYVDADGNELQFVAAPHTKDSSMSFGASQMGKLEQVEIPGYSKALYINDESGALGHSHLLYAQKEMDNTPYMDIFDLDYANTPTGQRDKPFEPDYYDAVIYSLSGTDVSKDQMVDIMGGLA